MDEPPTPAMAQRFRGLLPVVVDVETAGFDPQRNALLEIAAVLLTLTPQGLARQQTHGAHVIPFPGAELEPASLTYTGIDPDHPFRAAVSEAEALGALFQCVRQAVRDQGCKQAILVGHNPAFDLAFLRAAAERSGIKRNPFHAFTTLDTATLSALILGQTALPKALQASGLGWDSRQAHSAIYDAEQTAELFCWLVNRWDRSSGNSP